MTGYIQALIDSHNRRLNRASSPIIRYEIKDRINELKDILEYLNKKEIIETKQGLSSFVINTTSEKLNRDLEKVLGERCVKTF